jgi:hypothetical protein
MHSLFVQVQGIGADREIELRMSALPSTSEGQVGSPIAIDVANVATGAGVHDGQVSPDRPSYYQLVNLEQDVAYLVRVTSVHEQLGMLLFRTPFLDTSYDDGVVTPGQPFEVAIASDPASGYATSAFFTLEQLAGSESPSDLHIEVIESPIQSEGVLTPVPLTLGTPHQSVVDGARASYYELSGLTPGTPYMATMTNVPVLLDVEVSTGGYALPSCMWTAAERVCTFYASYPTIKLRARAMDVPSATFTLTVSSL